MNRVRGLIEKLIKNIEPSARLLSFGSSCNSFGLRNSGKSPVSMLYILEKELMIDMDLVVLIDDENAGLDPSHLVQMMGDLLERVSSCSSFSGVI
jgi:terminal uridylyltransferase